VELSQHVTSKLKTRDLDSVRNSFNDFLNSLNRVNAEGLADHPKMLWKEFLMLLGNDAIEGSQATNIQLTEMVEASLRNNIRRMREQFMLTHEGHGQQAGTNDMAAMEMPKMTIPEEFRLQLSGMLDAYLKLQTSLSTDNQVESVAAITGLESVFVSIGESQLDEDTKTVWKKEQRSLGQILERLKSAGDIEAVRAEFALLSDEMLVVVQKFRINEARGIYELHCPMAFDGRGATWLQDNDQPKNPFYGASMLTCADRVRKIETAGHADAKMGGHQHE
jgi:Cu(I)/Ag(I) efflux system membrane fusion protein